MKNPEIVIADDHLYFAQTLKNSLKDHNITVIAEAANGLELLEILVQVKPDLVLLDLEMPKMNGSEAFDKIKSMYPEIRIIIMSIFASEELIENFISRGANGFMPKELISPDLGNLYEAIKEVVSGSGYYFLDRYGLKHFTKKETEVVNYIHLGITSKRIASQMGVSEKTIEGHRKNIYRKTNSKNLAHFLNYVFKGGLKYLGFKSGKLPAKLAG